MGAVAIWFGKYAKILASLGLVFKAGAKIINDTGDPSSVAVDAPKGSLYISTNGNVYRKTDNGGSTNWNVVASNVAQVVRVGGAGADYPTIAAMHAAITDNGPAKQYVALLSPVVFTENVSLKPFISLVGVGNGTNSPTIVGKITCSGFPAGQITTINRIGQQYTVASDGEVCNDWSSPVLANDCFFQFSTANNYGFTGIRQDCSELSVTQVVTVLSFVSAVSTFDGSTKDITAFEMTGNGYGSGSNQNEIRVIAQASSGKLTPRKVSSSGAAVATIQGNLLRVVNTKIGSTATACMNGVTAASTGSRTAAGDQIQVSGNLASATAYCSDVAADFEATGASVNIASSIPIANITNTVVGGTQKIWLASTNRLVTKAGNGIAIVTPLDLVDTGFVEWGTAGADYWTYVAATRTFTVAKRGSGLVKSAPVVWAAGQSVVLTDFATNYVYVDSGGVLRNTTTRTETLSEENILLFEPWVQNLNSVVAKENHPVKFQVSVSGAWHRMFGALLQSTDSLLAINGVATNREIDFQGPNVLTDHGIDSTIPATTPVTWKIMGKRASDGKMYQYASASQLPSITETSAALTVVAAGAFVVGQAYEIRTPGSTNFTLIGAENNSVGTCFTATGVGSGTGNAYQLTTIPNEWVVYRLGVVKDSIQSSSPTFIAVLHNASYGNETAARNAIAADSIAAFPPEAKALEIVRVGYAVINGNAGGTGTMTTPVTDLDVFRSASGGGGSSTSGSLTLLNTTNFGGQLAATESNTQAAFDRIDDYGYIPAWVATTATYRIGNVVKQYGSVYRCITAHTASAAFSTDIAKWEQVSIAKFATVAAAEAASGSDNELCYVVETETLYRYETAGGAFTDDNLWVLSTGAGGNTRWIGVAGKYNRSRKLSTTNFGGQLAATESNTQSAFDRIDDYGYIPTWNTGLLYRVGNVVKQYGSIYRCITAHTASAAFATDIAKWEQASIAKFATVAAAEAASGSDNELCYVVEKETLYRFEASGSSFTDDNLWVLSTGAGGNTRWLGVAGKYNRSRKLSELGLTIAAGGSIDLSSAVGSERSYITIGNAVGQNAMSTTPFGASAPAEPMTVWLIGLHNTYTVTLSTNDAAQGALIAGGFIELGRGAAICLKYSPNMARWVEIARSSGTF